MTDVTQDAVTETVEPKSGLDALIEKSEQITKAEDAPKTDQNVGEGSQKPANTPPRGSSSSPVKQAAAAPKTADLPVEKPAFTPNFKFKVHDKEHEFDEALKAVIKDEATEKKVRELYERGHGIDLVKQSRDNYQTQLTQATEKIQRTDEALEQIGKYAAGNDWDSFFGALKIAPDRILAYAVDLVKRQQDPAYASAIEKDRHTRMTVEQYEAENQRLSAGNQQLAINQRMFELDQAISRPEITAIAQAFNAGMENPGAFREQVIRIGQAYAAQGKDIPVSQAVDEAVKYLKAANPTIGQPPQTVVTSQVVTPSQKPVIPSVQGRGTSPIKSTIKNLDDLKKRARELGAMS